MKTYIRISALCLIAIALVSCVQEEHLKTVTFKVDMTALENVGEVGLKGEFTNPQWGQILPLEDPDGDGIYEATFSQETAQSIAEFKFVHNGVYELKGQNNRQLKMEYKPETIVYWAVYDNPNGKQE